MRIQPARTIERRNARVDLIVYSSIPSCHQSHFMPNNAHWPALREGECAVVDPTPKRVELGGLYLIEQSNGPRVWQVNKSVFESADDGSLLVDLNPTNRPASRAELDEIVADAAAQADPGTIPVLSSLYMSDGPVGLDYLADRIIGRVVGVCVPGPGSKEIAA